MRLIALEVADSGIVAVNADGEVSPASPGVALLDGPVPVVGRPAADQERLQPRRIHDRFWDRLDTEPLGRPHPSHLSTADLAHAHLDQIWKDLESPTEAALLAVPGTFDTRELGLLLGIARSVGITVRGLVDSAVAATAWQSPSPGRLIHVDLLLHRVVVTELAVGEEVVRLRVETDDRVGLLTLRDAWARAVAARFVLTTRFDPLKLANTEQSLCDRLPSLLESLGDAEELELSMTAGGRDYRTDVTRSDVHGAGEASCHRIAGLVAATAGKGGWQVMLTDRAAALPGLGAVLARQSGTDVVILEPVAAARGALLHADRLLGSDEEVPFVCRLPLRDRQTARHGQLEGSPETPGGARGGTSPTHIAHGGRAHAITAEPLVFGIATDHVNRGIDIGGNTAGISRSHCSVLARDGRAFVEDHSTYGTYLNGDRIDGCAELIAGDHLRLGTPGVELQAIVFED